MEKVEGIKINKPVSLYGPGMSPYLLLPICALASTFICTGGWRSGLRATLLGASLLSGLFMIKKLCPSDSNWKKRVLYFALAGIIAGLLAASIISALEFAIGSPTLNNNPYNQDNKKPFLYLPALRIFYAGMLWHGF